MDVETVRLPDWDWHHDDALLLEKLANSLERHGQLAPVVVRDTDDGHEVVDGRRRLVALRALGHKHVLALSVGRLWRSDAVRLALDLELRSEIDYVRLAWQVSDLAAEADDPDAFPGLLAATAPWDAERIGYFVQLAHWDWSIYSEGSTDQAGFAWDAPDGPAEPPAASLALSVPAEVVRQPDAGAAPTEAPASIEVLPDEVWDGPEPAPSPVVATEPARPILQPSLFGD